MTQERDILEILSGLLQELDSIRASKEADSGADDIVEASQTQTIEKRPSLWGRVKKLCMLTKNKNIQAATAGESNGGTKQKISKDEEDAELEIRKLQSDILQMKTAFQNLTQFQRQMSKSLATTKLKPILQNKNSNRSRSHDLKEIRRKIFNLKCEIPSLLFKQSSRGLSKTDSLTGEENGETIDEAGSDIDLIGLHVSQDFKTSSAFEEVLEKFETLGFTQKLCFLSFAVFPENRAFKRTMLMYWWIGEGFLLLDGESLPEESVMRLLDEFSAKGLLEPVDDERKLKPNSYKMEPHVHSAVIYLAEMLKLFALYSRKGKLTMGKSGKDKVCLVRGSSLQPEAKTSKMEPKTLQSIFNSSERYPDFTFKWFQFMESLRVLYLGRWERTARRHIEVESTEFLKYMGSLKNLRLASFQGISRIEKLENPICKLPELVILDLRACYNLEVLPDDIGSLEKLVYLDVSDCFMLDRMPKGIARLSRLQVLKGFVIGQSDDEKNCAVKHLVNLRKLTITVNKYGFKVENLMESLGELKQLEGLKIAWGARFPEDDQRGEKGEETEENRKEEKENQRDSATEKKQRDLKEQEEEMGHKSDVGDTGKGDEESSKGKANVEEGKKRDAGGDAESSKSDKGAPQEPEDTVQNNTTGEKTKEEEEGDGEKGKANVEEGKKRDAGGDAESSKSDKGAPQESSKDTMQSNTTGEKTKEEEEGDGEKGKVDNVKKGKEQDDEVDTESSKSDKGAPQEPKDTVQNNTTSEKTKEEKEEDGEKAKANGEEGKKQDDEVDRERSKSDKGALHESSKDTVQSNTIGDKTKEEKEEDGDKGKATVEEGKKQDDEADAERSKSDKVPPQESKDTVQSNTTSEKTKEEKEGDGDKGKANVEEGKKQDDKSDKGPPQESSKDTVQSNTTGEKTKEEEEGDGDKGKADNVKKGKEQDGVEAVTVAETVKKRSPSGDSEDEIHNKPDDPKKGDKQDEKGDGATEKVRLEEGNNQDEKKNPPQESKDTNQSKPDKTKKMAKKVSFSDDKKRENATAEETRERPTKPAPKESGLRKAKQLMAMGKETKKLERYQETTTTVDKLPSSLKKLELECFPHKKPPSWLNPKNLDNLEKLYIRGGKLTCITEEEEIPTAANNCRVQILRLKYLNDFKAEWKDLRELFPQMTLLEKYQCPKVAFCPTDGNGIWRSQPQTSQDM